MKGGSQDVVIGGYKRTAFGRLGGALSTLSAMQLGAVSLAAAIEDAGIAPSDVDLVLGGQAIQGGAGQNPIRQASIEAGVPPTVPAFSINAVCLSGIEAVRAGVRAIITGEAGVVAICAQESMSTAPRLLDRRVSSKQLGGVEIIDSLMLDGLTDARSGLSMGEYTEKSTAALGVDRESQDQWALRSHQLAAEAVRSGWLAGEIVQVTPRPGETGADIGADEGIRGDVTAQRLASLRPAFAKTGTITAGNASQLSDGGAALVIMSRERAVELDVEPFARIVGGAFVAGLDGSLETRPAEAIMRALGTVEVGPEALDFVEINEAFASVSLVSGEMLGVSRSRINVSGGAIALGHPLAASGVRIIGHLARLLRTHERSGLGAAALCGGGGQGSAIVLSGMDR